MELKVRTVPKTNGERNEANFENFSQKKIKRPPGKVFKHFRGFFALSLSHPEKGFQIENFSGNSPHLSSALMNVSGYSIIHS